MPHPNVIVTVDDPKALYDGTSPLAPFEVRYIDLYRFASRADALANNSPTLVISFTLVTTAQSAPWTGPYTYGTYDAAQSPSTWYAYRFRGVSDQTSLSEPWSPLGHNLVTLRQVIEALPEYLGDLVRIYPYTPVDADTITVPAMGDPNILGGFFDGWHVLFLDLPGFTTSRVSATSGSTVELYPPLAAPPPAGQIALFGLMPWENVRASINRAMGEMQLLKRYSFPNTSAPVDAPMGVHHPSDIIDARVYIDSEIWQFCRFEAINDVPVRLRFYAPSTAARIELSVLTSLRDSEGDFTSLTDGVAAPRRWLEIAAAYYIARTIRDSEPLDPWLDRLTQNLQAQAREASLRYTPEVQRRTSYQLPSWALPGPTMR